MKQLYLSLFSLVILGFISCDGRDRLDKTPQEVLKENKLLDSFSEKEVRFVPESYAEKIIDTIFENGYVVRVKMYSDMNNYITVDLENETVNYRDFNMDIDVIRDNETILSLTINKEHEIVYESLSRLNFDEYYLRDFWVSKNNKYYKDVPCIYFEYYSIKSKDSSILEITPVKDGRVDFGVTELIN